ncbi:MAG: iron(III) transport system substrate-binding protein, partial [Yoonia sp.]
QVSGVDTSELLGWAQNMSEISNGKTIGIYAGALGIAYNSEILADKDIAPPACWADLEDPRFVGEIQVANPNSSGTAYTELATFVQLFGEDEAFIKLAAVGKNVNSYTKSGSAPSKAAARGETGVSIGFMHDMVKLAATGFPLEIVAPCEGTGYEVGAVSIIEGARNLEAAKAWVAFALRADVQSRAPEVGSFQVPSNSNAEVAPESPDLASIKLIDYDFATYGSSATRARLLARWDSDVGDPGAQ